MEGQFTPYTDLATSDQAILFQRIEVRQEKAQRWSRLEDWGRSDCLSSTLAPVISVKEKMRPPAESQGITELAGPLRKVAKGLKQLVCRIEVE